MWGKLLKMLVQHKTEVQIEKLGNGKFRVWFSTNSGNRTSKDFDQQTSTAEALQRLKKPRMTKHSY